MHNKTRSSQHLGILEWTGKPTKRGVPTAITRHTRTKSCVCLLDDFNIIGRETDFHLRLTKESQFIKLEDYNLHKQQKSMEVFLF